MSSHRWTRRQMLRVSAAAAPLVVAARVLGRDGCAPPSELVRVGVIGCGGRARMIREGADVRGFQVVAACDCQREKAEQFARELSAGQPWGVYDDFREMIDKEKLDAVMVETTTHARAWIAILAMQAGMDVYIEKPMCLTIAEGRAMVQAARRYQRVTQVGTQQRSMPINNWASDLVKNGRAGQNQDRAGAAISSARCVGRPPMPLAPPRRIRALVGRLDESGWCCALIIPSCTKAGPTGGTTMAADCALASPAWGTHPTTRSTARWARTTPGPSNCCSKSPSRCAKPATSWAGKPSAASCWAKPATSIRAPSTTAWQGLPDRGPKSR